jgi:Zn-dependent protease with chaperone function
MGPRLAALVVASVVGLTLPVWAADQSDAERTSRKALAFFEGHSEETIDAFLMRLRPAPLDEASRAKVIASLPQEGEIQPSRNDRKKLSAAQRILDYSARSGAVTIKVVELDSAFVGLYYRTVVLVSGKALALFSPDELAAVVAHEMGHDDDWNEYSTAMQARDNEGIRELELKADGIAVLTLEHLGSSPDRLVSAAQKVMRRNDCQDRTAGATPPTSISMCDRYVSLDDRIAFIRAVAQIRWADWPPTVTAGLGPDRR